MLKITAIGNLTNDVKLLTNESTGKLNTPATTVPVGRANGAVKPLK